VKLSRRSAAARVGVDEAHPRRRACRNRDSLLPAGSLLPRHRGSISGASLEAAPTLYVEHEGDSLLVDEATLAEIAITSNAKIVRGAAPADAFRLADVPGVGVVFAHAQGEKCARCWMILPEVGTHAAHPDLCNRCTEAVG